MSINSGGRGIDNTRDSIIPTNNEKQNKQNEGCRVRQITPKTNYMPAQNDLDANKSKKPYAPVSINNRKVRTINFFQNKLSIFRHYIVQNITALFKTKTSNIKLDPQFVRIENYIARLTSNSHALV